MWCKDEVTIVFWNLSVHPRVLPERYCWTDVLTELLIFFHIIFQPSLEALQSGSWVTSVGSWPQYPSALLFFFFFDWLAWQLFLSLSFCHLLGITGQLSSSVRVEGDVKNVMIHRALTSFAAVTVSRVGEGERKKTERRNWSQVLLFPSQTFYEGATVTVDLGWKGCSLCVDTEFTQLFNGRCCPVCACARARGNASLR